MAKSKAVKSADLTIVNPVVESSAPIAIPQEDTHIGQAQSFCLGILTFEVQELLVEGAGIIQGEIIRKKTGANIIQKLGDMMFANGATWRDVGTKAPQGETKEGEVQRLELTRQMRKLIEGRMDATIQQAIGFDVKGAVADFNKKRKADGLSAMSAVEIEALNGLDGQPLGVIPEGTMALRKLASDTVSQYLKRIVSALKKLEPEEDTGGDEGGEGEEVVEPVSEKTVRQQYIDSLNNTARIARKDPTIPAEHLTALYEMIGQAGGVADLDAE